MILLTRLAVRRDLCGRPGVYIIRWESDREGAGMNERSDKEDTEGSGTVYVLHHGSVAAVQSIDVVVAFGFRRQTVTSHALTS